MSKIQNGHYQDHLRILCYVGIFLGLFLRVLNLGNVPTSVFDETRYIEAARTLVGLTPFEGHKNWKSVSPEIAKSPDPNFFHPPLGKLIIGASIRLIGDSPLGWRFPSLLFGVLSLGLFYLLATKIFDREVHALFATSLFALEFQQILHSRIAMLDMFVAFAFLLAFYGYFLLKEGKTKVGFVVIVSACLFGMSVKHIALVIMPSIVLAEFFYAKEKSIETNAVLLGAFCSSGLLYLFWTFFYQDHSFMEWIKLQRDANNSIMGYFKPHRYGSHPAQWLFNGKAIWYFFENRGTQSQGLLCWGTPAVWWLLFPAILENYYSVRSRASAEKWLSVLICLTVYVAAMFVILRNREGFFYYMLPMTPFIYLLVAKVSVDLEERWNRTTSLVLALSIAAVVWFSPVLAGFSVNKGWIDSIIGFAGS